MTKEEFIVHVRYLGWLCYQMGANLPLHDVEESDYAISKERFDSLMLGTQWALNNPEATPKDNHDCWMKSKASQGWTYGDILDVEKKKHPSMIPYEELSEVERRKDDMDMLMVKLASELYDKL